MTQDKLMPAALRAVADACRVARQVQRDIQNVRRIAKDDKSPVTVADFAVQAVIALSLRQQLGESLIVGEETTGQLRTAEQAAVLEAVVDEVRAYQRGINPDEVLRAIDAGTHDATAPAYWTLDPIDGTKGFLRGQQYAIALAYIEQGEVTLGVMGCPNLPANQQAPLDVADSIGTIYAASRNGGAWEHAPANPNDCRRIHAARYAPPQPIRACESVEAAHSKQDDSRRILAAVGGAGAPARLDSQCKYAVVARGQADVYMRIPTSKTYIEKIWDHAAGAIIATEAGAVVSDITGSPLDFTRGPVLSANRGIVCAAPGAHERIIEAIERLGVGALV